MPDGPSPYGGRLSSPHCRERLSILDWTTLTREFVTLLVVIDPVGSIPVFLFAVQHVPRALHCSFALRAVVIAGLVLLAFLVGGQVLLETLGLRFDSFQIAGGIILFLFAMTMIFGESKPAREIEEASAITSRARCSRVQCPPSRPPVRCWPS